MVTFLGYLAVFLAGGSLGALALALFAASGEPYGEQND